MSEKKDKKKVKKKGKRPRKLNNSQDNRYVWSRFDGDWSAPSGSSEKNLRIHKNFRAKDP